jgi:hypothetical protein
MVRAGLTPGSFDKTAKRCGTAHLAETFRRCHRPDRDYATHNHGRVRSEKWSRFPRAFYS